MPYIDHGNYRENNDQEKPEEKNFPDFFTCHGITPRVSYHDGQFSGWLRKYIFLIIALFAKTKFYFYNFWIGTPHQRENLQVLE